MSPNTHCVASCRCSANLLACVDKGSFNAAPRTIWWGRLPRGGMPVWKSANICGETCKMETLGSRHYVFCELLWTADVSASFISRRRSDEPCVQWELLLCCQCRNQIFHGTATPAKISCIVVARRDIFLQKYMHLLMFPIAKFPVSKYRTEERERACYEYYVLWLCLRQSPDVLPLNALTVCENRSSCR